MAKVLERNRATTAPATTTTTTTGSDIGDRTDAAQGLVPPEVAKRLVVELTRRSARDLAWLVDQEELNKTTLVNRALQVYRLIMEAQIDGKQIVIEEVNRDQEIERNRLLLV